MGSFRGYDVKRTEGEKVTKYVFVSQGKEKVIKSVQYHYVQVFDGCPVYNLGFGDYDPLEDCIIDNTESNNGDVYSIFYTVLNTIPDF